MKTNPLPATRPQQPLPALTILLAILIGAAPADANFRYGEAPDEMAADNIQQLHESHEHGKEISHGLSREFAWLYERGQYPQALAAAKRARSLARSLYGAEHISNADPLLKLGIIHQTLGQLASARGYFEESLQILRDNHSQDSRHVAITLTNLGNLYFELGDYPASEQAHRQALALRRATFGPRSPEAAQSLYNLGVLYEHQQDFARAARRYQDAIDLWSASLGSSHPFISNTRQKLARVHLALRRTLQRNALSATLRHMDETNAYR